ncbi:uncharacterized protein [Periplaneta americana]|uniref:uncharacterized protein isoform X2 n=1 Tax=Periplaneta americana TaxID=6978 RepID=UPI0037E8C49D
MEVMESGKPPLKDRGNMVTSVVSTKLAEEPNNSDGCEESVVKTAELHNGEEQLVDSNESTNGSKGKKDEKENAKTADAEDTEHPSVSGEKWKLQFDLSDSASTSDNDASEVEVGEKAGENIQKEGDNVLNKSDCIEDSEDFQGFAVDATLQTPGTILSKLIGLTESTVDSFESPFSRASTSYDCKTSGKQEEKKAKVLPQSTIFVDGSEPHIQEGIRFAMRLISDSDVVKPKKEPVVEGSTSRGIVRSERILRRRSQQSDISAKSEEKTDSGDEKVTEVRVTRRKLKERNDTVVEERNDKVVEERNDKVVEERNDKVVEERNDKVVEERNDKVVEDAKLPPDVLMEDIGPPDITASGVGPPSEDASSEVISSAASSPSVSSRGSFKVSSERYHRGVSPALSGSSGKSSKKFSTDMSDPAYLKPFEYGWKRELVHRSNTRDSGKRQSDVYYYTPSGKKVRSLREVLKFLDDGNLTPENFTFFKEPLGVNDPSKEVIRDAKKDPSPKPEKKTTPPKPKMTLKPSPVSKSKATSSRHSSATSSPASKTKATTPKPSASISPSSTSPVSASPVPMSPASDAPSTPATQSPRNSSGRTVPPKTFPKIKVSSVRLQKLPANKLPFNKSKKTESSEDGELEIGMLPPMWSPNDSPYLKKSSTGSQSVTAVSWSSKSVIGKKTTNEPCSIRCVGVMGLIPSLQCRVCLCLYHPECVGLGSISETIHSYVCKNCQQDAKDGKTATASKVMATTTSTTPPPLTPISALGAGNRGSPTENSAGHSPPTPPSPPKLQRLPRMADSGKLVTVPRFVKVPKSRESSLVNQQGTKTTASKGTIVGSVTTWLPPSSTIQLSSSTGAKTSSPVSPSPSSSVSSTTNNTDPLTSSSTANVQAIARMGGKKYIVVPKHNVLSVCPAMAATATTPTAKSSVQVGDPSPLGDKAPVTLSNSLVFSNAAGRATTVISGTQALIGQPQVLMPSAASANGDQSISLVQNSPPLTNFVTTGGHILPKPSAYLVSSGIPGGLQNPPGVLLVPVVGSGSTLIPTISGQDALNNKTTTQTQQYLIVNAPPGSFQSGNFILGNLQQTVKPTETVAKTGDADGKTDGQTRDNEEVSKGKRKASSQETESPPSKRTKGTAAAPPAADSAPAPSQGPSLESERRFMQYFMMNVCAGYSSLLHVFQYLKVQELLRAARVCRMWRDMASHPSLWRTVRMKNSQVGDWEGLVKSLRRHETQHLDLRKMLVPSEDTHAMWDAFCNAIGRATSLSRLDLCRCPARVVERVAESCLQLRVLNALAIKCSVINLQAVGNQRYLQELRLKSLSGIHLSTTLAALKQLSSLKHLSLTTFKELGKMETNILGTLKNLESLELGECCDFPPEFGPDSLSRLKKLERLRLEKGQGKDCPTFSILAGIASLPKLTHLELVNFDVKPGFDKALAQCTNIRRLLIIPTYVTQSATTNHMVLNGVNHLSNSLTHFVWGVTHELLKVTELFVDQCEGQKDKTSTKSGKKSSSSDSIPILKPIHQPAQMKDDDTDKLNDQENSDESAKNEDRNVNDDEGDDDAKASAAAPQVEILPLPKLQRLLTSSLPKTKVKILKIPFHATWRQTISEPAP